MQKESKIKILIISYTQWGYLTDHFKLSPLINKKFDVDFLCLDANNKKIADFGVNIIYLKKSRFFNLLFFTISCIKYIYKNSGNYSLFYIVYFQLSFVLPLLFIRSKFLLDIRTLSVHKSYLIRGIKDLNLMFTIFFYKHISIINDDIAKKIKLKKYTVIPLGSDSIGFSIKCFKHLNLLYIGTFNNRNLHQMIEGVSLFIKKTNLSLTLDILGRGTTKETKKISNYIEMYNLEKNVKMHGWVDHITAKSFFMKCNVGVSYVPKNKYFNLQPPTKIYEYAKSGLAIIATSTYASKKIVNSEIGVLCNDNSSSFADAIYELYSKRNRYKSNLITTFFKKNSWNVIAEKKLIPLLKKIAND